MQTFDAIGNPLIKDDLVVVSQGDQQLLGIVLDIKEPSLLTPGKDQMRMPGIVRIALMPLTVAYDMQNPRCSNVVKVVKPPNFKTQES